jgi:hypothetical protein
MPTCIFGVGPLVSWPCAEAQLAPLPLGPGLTLWVDTVPPCGCRHGHSKDEWSHCPDEERKKRVPPFIEQQMVLRSVSSSLSFYRGTNIPIH